MLTRPFSKKDISLLTSSYSPTMMLPTARKTHTRDNSSTNLLENSLVLMSMLDASSIMKVKMLHLKIILLFSPTTKLLYKVETVELSNQVLMIMFSWVSSIMVLQDLLLSQANTFMHLISSLHSRLCMLTSNIHSLSTILRLVSQVPCSWISPLIWISTPFLLPTPLNLLGLLTVELAQSFRERILVLALVICSLWTGLKTLTLSLTLRISLCKSNTMLLLNSQQPLKFSNGVTCHTPVSQLVISSVELLLHLGSANIWRISSSSTLILLSSLSHKSSLLVSWTPEQLESNI